MAKEIKTDLGAAGEAGRPNNTARGTYNHSKPDLMQFHKLLIPSSSHQLNFGYSLGKADQEARRGICLTYLWDLQ